MGRKKTSKAKKRIRAVKERDPTAVINEDDWVHHEPEEKKKAPHSFVIYRGKVGRYLKELMRDLRNVLEPYTASNLKMRKGNVLKDYISIASYFHVTHLGVLSRTQISPYLKICKVPRGPTLTFRILKYTLARDVLSALKKQVTFDAQFQHHPMLILNNFNSDSNEHQLITTTFQNMFPPINVSKVRVAEIKRILLMNYFEEDDSVEIRHYTITYKTSGVSKRVQKVLLSKHGKIPNLGNCTDIAEFLNRDGYASESEGEDNTEIVEVPQKMKMSKGLEEVGIKLVELGPRIKMQLIKVEDGMCDGEVLYHKLVEKTAEEKLLIRKTRNLKKRQKVARKREQEMNIERKKKDKENHKKRCLEGMGVVQENQGMNEDDNDREWYRKEVGEEPDEDMFSHNRPTGSNQSKGFQKRPFKRRGEEDFESFPTPIKVSRFAHVKEKAKQKKLEMRQGMERAMNRKAKKEALNNRGGRKGRSGGFGKGKGDGTYSKPGRGKGMGSKVKLRVNTKRTRPGKPER